jgi:glycosyltransferase involved in cell wall biosynthesis
MSTGRYKISIVTPCFNEQDNIERCCEAVRDLFAKALPEYDYEHICADNGSRDGTRDILRRLAAADPRIKVILNTRNFGPVRSTYNGILASSGDAVLLSFPVDLQDPPELIAEFVHLWRQGYPVVYGVRQEREEGLLLRNIRRFFYYLVNKSADFHIPMNVGEFQLVDKKVVRALAEFHDYYPYIRGMVAYCGFRSVGVSYTWRKRERGRSKASKYLYLDQALNGLLSFSNLPIRFTLAIGLIVSILSLSYGFVSLASAFLSNQEIVPGIKTIIVGLFFLGGMILMVLGMLGEYLFAVYNSVRWRPMVIEEERINLPARDRSPA